jgi:hypothetical protein
MATDADRPEVSVLIESENLSTRIWTGRAIVSTRA